MADFIHAVNRLSVQTDKAIEDLSGCLKTKFFEKGDLLLKRGQVCSQLYFINYGLVKTFFQTDTKEFIMRFFPEHNLVTVIDSFTMQAPSNYEIMALEKTHVTYLSHGDLEALCKTHHCVENAFRKLMSIAVVNMMKRISEMLEENASERYNHFLRESNPLLHRIQLGDLANYLGITQVSLSRIRAQK